MLCTDLYFFYSNLTSNADSRDSASRITQAADEWKITTAILLACRLRRATAEKRAYLSALGRQRCSDFGKNSLIKLSVLAAKTVICHHAAFAPRALVTTCPPPRSFLRIRWISSLLPQRPRCQRTISSGSVVMSLVTTPNIYRQH